MQQNPLPVDLVLGLSKGAGGHFKATVDTSTFLEEELSPPKKTLLLLPFL